MTLPPPLPPLTLLSPLLAAAAAADGDSLMKTSWPSLSTATPPTLRDTPLTTVTFDGNTCGRSAAPRRVRRRRSQRGI